MSLVKDQLQPRKRIQRSISKYDLNFEIVCQLSKLLDPYHIFGNDWRMVAHHLGNSFLEIQNIERRFHESPTETVLKNYKTKTNHTDDDILNDIREIAEKIERMDVADLLEGELGKVDQNSNQTLLINNVNRKSHSFMSQSSLAGFEADDNPNQGKNCDQFLDAHTERHCQLNSDQNEGGFSDLETNNNSELSSLSSEPLLEEESDLLPLRGIQIRNCGNVVVGTQGACLTLVVNNN